MKKYLELAWRGFAAKAWLSMHEATAGGAQEVGHAMTSFTVRFNQTLADLFHGVPDDGTKWSAQRQSCLVHMHVKPSEVTPTAAGSAFVKSVRYGFAVASLDERWLLPSERSRAFVDSDGRVGSPVAVRLPYVPSGDSFDAPFRFRFKGRKPNSTATRHASSSASAIVVRVPPSRAPVSFRCVKGDGRHGIDVRDVDGVAFRPILAPGAWRPITEPEFLEACSGSEAWKDDPFAPYCTGVPLSLDEATEPRPDPRPVEAVARERALDLALARAGRLVSIEGVVHRETFEPTVHPVLLGRDGSRPRIGVAWRMSGLASTDVQDWFPNLSREKNVDFRCGREHGDADFMGVPARHGNLVSEVAWAAAERLGLKVRLADMARASPLDGAGTARDATEAMMASIVEIARSCPEHDAERREHEGRGTVLTLGAVRELASVLERRADRDEANAAVEKAFEAACPEGWGKSCLPTGTPTHVGFVKAAIVTTCATARRERETDAEEADESEFATSF